MARKLTVILVTGVIVGIFAISAPAGASPRTGASHPRVAPHIAIFPSSGRPGTQVDVYGQRFQRWSGVAACQGQIWFTDAAGVRTEIGLFAPGLKGFWFTGPDVPTGSAVGAGLFTAVQRTWDPAVHWCAGRALVAVARFVVTD